MISRPHRATRQQIEATIKTGRGAAGVFVSVKYKREGVEAPRATVVCSAKVAKTAVGRNRLKRRLRAILQPLLPCVSAGTTIVVFAKKEAISATHVELKTDLQILMSKL